MVVVVVYGFSVPNRSHVKACRFAATLTWAQFGAEKPDMPGRLLAGLPTLAHKTYSGGHDHKINI